jgi:Dehydrogenases with different specificities (related to short-chain alcohol dehydrogenases)
MKPTATMGLLEGKSVVITGAAGGIGAASARFFVQAGARVVLADVDGDRAGTLAQELGDRARALRCDHTNPRDCAGAVSLAVEAWGKLDVLFNNAGTGWTGEFASCDAETFERLMAVNLMGPWRMTQAALPHLLAAAEKNPCGASLLFMSSGLGLHGRPMTSGYTMVKHGIVGLMRSLAQEFGPRNLRVNALCPGIVDTAMARATTGAWGPPEEAIERVRLNTPLRRNATPEAVAATAAFLCSDLASAIHCVALPVDGGGHG